ncbi:MAG TPA: glycosyltransferase, partial [Asticcacaulis sp.]|nr:glycosyltransferase [Asticcacaulis sp.]
ARARGQRIVYEADDDLLDSAGLIKRGYSGDTQALASRVTALARQADAVTVSTEGLKARFARLNNHVHLVPNYLDDKLWRLGEASPSTKARTGGITKIGYIGTPSHVADLALISEAMADIKKTYGAMVEIEVIGGFQDVEPLFGTRIGLPKKNQYPDFVTWLYNVVDWDIGLIPLVEDDFNRAKSNLKFLEYSALGLASVVSDVPTYKDVVKHRHNALSVPNNRQAWKKAVTELIETPDLRATLSQNARDLIRPEYGVRHHADLYLKILEGP